MTDSFWVIARRRRKKVTNLFKAELSLAYSLLTGHAVVWGAPPILMIEPTNLCNLRCPQCVTGSGQLRRKQGIMPMEDFTRIICEVENSLMFLMLFYCGEPFVNPHLIEMIRFAHERGIVVLVSTNGHFLKGQVVARQVLLSGLDRLVISLYGASQETYDAYANRGDFDQVIGAVRGLVAMRNEMGLHRPIIDLEFIVMKHNEHELGAMKSLGRSLGADLVTLKTAYVMDLNDPEQVATYLPSNLQYSRYRRDDDVVRRKSDVRTKCQRLWRIATIYWDGTMAGCCCDQDGYAPMGNVLAQNLGDVWRSAHYNTFRQRMIENTERPEICDHCTGGLERFYLVESDRKSSFWSYRRQQIQIYGAQFWNRGKP